MPYQRVARFVVDGWWAIQRRLAHIDSGSDEARMLAIEAVALREEYEHLIVQAVAHDRPVPPPFPRREGQLL
ncbi:MAG TPA: hypothetical protein VID26_13040 [Candidatus Limnocylindrales bacterium]|jgi:hypothetical protein